MKNFIVLISILVLCSTIAKSQNFVVLVGDSVELKVVVPTGLVQWQQSTDSIIWTDIVGYTNSVHVFAAISSPTNRMFYRAKITDTLCPLATPVFSSIIRQKIIISTSQVVVGDWFRGGIVFYIDGTGHGLIAPPQNQSTSIQWGCNGTLIGTSISDGATNTVAIMAGCSTRPIAASLCGDLVLNGYSDWYLPSRSELGNLYPQKAVVGGFTSNYYWTSYEGTGVYAYRQHFGTGYQDNVYKYANYYVRCIRAF